MSGKYEKKKKKSYKKSRGLWLGIAAALVLIGVVWALAFFLSRPAEPSQRETSPQSTTTPVTPTETELQSEPMEPVGSLFNLGRGLEITDLGTYTGAYMEDGSDEIVSGVMMIVVKNTGENALQYAEITLSGEAGEACFTLSTLNPGESVVVLETERKSYAAGDDYTAASAEHVAFFSEELSCHEDELLIQPLDGGFNITNISGEDITGDIVIYFKDYAGDMLYGGITYRGRIEGGLKDGEIRQIMSTNFSATGTRVMFVTITEPEA